MPIAQLCQLLKGQTEYKGCSMLPLLLLFVTIYFLFVLWFAIELKTMSVVTSIQFYLKLAHDLQISKFISFRAFGLL